MTIIKNIPLRLFKKFLTAQGLKHTGGTGGHEKWNKLNLSRPVIIQTHEDPVPIHIVKSNLNTMGLKIKDLEEWLLNN